MNNIFLKDNHNDEFSFVKFIYCGKTYTQFTTSFRDFFDFANF